MKKNIVWIWVVATVVLVSCGTKRQLATPVPRIAIPVDSAAVADSVGLPRSLYPLLTFDHARLGSLVIAQPARPNRKPHRDSVEPPRTIVQGGTRITTRNIPVAAEYPGINRVKVYEFTHRDVPESFDGFRIAFAADLHYQSLLKAEGLDNLVRLLNAQQADALFLGGDYHEGCQYVPAVIEAMGRVKTTMGTWAVMGNNDYEACYAEIVEQMKRHNIRLLEHRVDELRRGKERILVAGIRNPFDLAANGQSPTLSLKANDFVIMLTHTPDYAEDVSVANTDLVLAGHTHGGQVTLFGLYAPIVPSRYGQRFLSGLKHNSHHIPMIITNGIGTSKKAVRMFAPSEVVLVILHRLK